MNFVLTILSSGRPTYLERTLASYRQHLVNVPRQVYIFDDGGRINLTDDVMPVYPPHWPPPAIEGEGSHLGQCAAHARCWQMAAASKYEWAFHIEDDVVLLRPLDLRDLKRVLTVEGERVAQMALVRCPWGAEIEHGGYIPWFPGLYERKITKRWKRYEWFSTTRNWANAPSLMRTGLARRFEWPVEPGCETAVGPILSADNETVFGLWGGGEPWVAHIGVERAAGSHGY